MFEVAAPLNVWLYARDLERSRRFYETQLGLPLWREEPGETLHFGVGGSLLSIHAANATDLPPRGVYVVLHVPAGIDELCDRLQHQGIVVERPLVDRPFGRSMMFRDPDGYEIWLCQPAEGETQYLRWKQAARARSRRVPVNRPRAAPRPHRRRPRTTRARHPAD